MAFFYCMPELSNRLTILKRTGSKLLCKCTCGNKTTITKWQFGKVKSCGCLVKEIQRKRLSLPKGEGAKNRAITKLKKKGVEWQLTREEVLGLIEQNCYYCGSPPNRVSRGHKGLNGIFVYNGLDRLDLTEGFILGNVVPCCEVCGRAKGDMSKEEFLSWASQLLR
jgi:hypothetical protein